MNTASSVSRFSLTSPSVPMCSVWKIVYPSGKTIKGLTLRTSKLITWSSDGPVCAGEPMTGKFKWQFASLLLLVSPRNLHEVVATCAPAQFIFRLRKPLQESHGPQTHVSSHKFYHLDNVQGTTGQCPGDNWTSSLVNLGADVNRAKVFDQLFKRGHYGYMSFQSF